MRKTILVLLTTMGLCASQAQDFIASDKYTVTNKRDRLQKEENGHALIDLVAIDHVSEPVATFEIAQIERLEDIRISSLRDPGLDGITEILKVRLAYEACCRSTDTYYFLVSENRDFIKLPRLENVYCEGSEADTHYIFPIQKRGREAMILRVRKYYSATHDLKEVEVIQSFAWNDDDFDADEATIAIHSNK